MTTRGFLMFAHNNDQIDYLLIALCNAMMIRANTRHRNVSVVTDEGSLWWLRDQRGDLVDQVFDQIIIVDQPIGSGEKVFKDTNSTTRTAQWHNGTRINAYEVSPYDETILLDADYLICDDRLDLAWDSPDDVLLNRKAITLIHELPDRREQRVEDFGIPLYWATCVFFRKGEEAKLYFDTVNHVIEYFDYYRQLYRLPGKLFRNDYIFSIATHVMNGFRSENVASFPVDTILTSFDDDELIDVKKNTLTFLIDTGVPGDEFNVGKVTTSVHVMNKFSIVRLADKIIEAYSD